MEPCTVDSIKNKIRSIKKILEDATCASLAPYPVVAIGSVVKATDKGVKRARKQKPDSKPV